MLDVLKNLFENNVISEEIKGSIEAAWEARITENREQVTQTLREEFSRKYEHDKSVMVEAVDRMITDGLTGELIEFADDRKQLAEMKIKYARKMTEDARTMKKFITRQLASEIRELHEDQKQTARKFKTLEKFVVEALAQEITEFYTDKKDLTNKKVRLIREGKKHLKAVKEEFIRRAAKKVDRAVTEGLKSELYALKEDIDSARRNDFGRKLFEAFVSEYQTSYLNEKSETAKLLKVINLKELALSEARKSMSKAKTLIESKKAEVASLKESQTREKIMNGLLAPLNAEQREIMCELMGGVKTAKLTESFDKYLPAVIAGKAPQKKKALLEAKEITGNKVSNSNRSSEDENIVDIRRLAGLKN